MLAFLQAHGVEIIAVMYALDKALEAVPGIESNSVFQLIGKVVGWLHDAFAAKPKV